jgi:hypothetical protein
MLGIEFQSGAAVFQGSSQLVLTRGRSRHSSKPNPHQSHYLLHSSPSSASALKKCAVGGPAMSHFLGREYRQDHRHPAARRSSSPL